MGGLRHPWSLYGACGGDSMTLATIPYESAVQVKKPVLVGWCDLCKFVYDPYPGPNTYCDGEHEWKLWAFNKLGDGGKHRLHKRLMWKCPNCDFYYLSRTALLEHEHEFI